MFERFLIGEVVGLPRQEFERPPPSQTFPLPPTAGLRVREPSHVRPSPLLDVSSVKSRSHQNERNGPECFCVTVLFPVF